MKSWGLLGLQLLAVYSHETGVPAVVNVVVGEPLRETRSQGHFICATLDWWPDSKWSPNPGSHYPWANASVLHLDLAHPTLVSAVAALAPLHLRIGGSLADQIVYDVDGTFQEACLEPLPEPNATLGYGWGCLSMPRWDQVADFCRAAECQVLFGLSALYGRTPDPSSPSLWSGHWNSTNARQLLEYSKETRFPLAGVELGNELDEPAGIDAKLPPEGYAKDFVLLRGILEELWSGEGRGGRPLLIGPDSSGFNDAWWFPQFLGNMTAQGTNDVALDVVTWHAYTLGSGNSSAVPEEILNASFLNSVADKCRNHSHTVATYAPNAQMWLGEGGGAYNSGQDGATNVFLSTFWYGDSLGTFAVQGHDAYCRQALVGGNYALMNSTTMRPNPDYYLARLWNQLMGKEVLAAFTDGALGGNGTQGDLRSYAHCLTPEERTRLGITGPVIFLINLGDAPREVELQVQGGGTRAPWRYEWRLSSPSLTSQDMYLNGKLLEPDPATGKVSTEPLPPAVVASSDALVVDAYSSVFLALPAGASSSLLSEGAQARRASSACA